MAYSPTTWFDRANTYPKIKASDLNRIEQGVLSNAQALGETDLTWTSGEFYLPSNLLVASSATLGDGNLRIHPVLLRRPVTIDRLSIAVTVVGSAGAVLRLGIYRNRGDAYPGDLLVDAGTVSGTAVANPTVTVAQTLTAGLWWFAVCSQGAATTQPTVATGAAPIPPVPLSTGTTAPGSTTFAGFIQNGVSGALPATFTTTRSASGQATRVAFRVA